MSKKPAAQVQAEMNKETQVMSLSVNELVGEERVVKIGEMVLYSMNNPLADGIVTHPAIVTKVNLNGSVSLTVFLETSIAYFTKIPLAKELQSGYYSFVA